MTGCMFHFKGDFLSDQGDMVLIFSYLFYLYSTFMSVSDVTMSIKIMMSID